MAGMTDYALGQGTGPLKGVRVVELAGIGPGPHAAMHLADLGADVIRVERPGGATSAGARETDLLTRGRPSVAMNLKDPAAVATVLDLVETADVLLEGMRPGAVERLGLGPAECQARNPRLVYGRMTGWGQDGPLAQAAGHDMNYIAISGALHGLGQTPDRPQFPSNLVGDFGGGALYLVVGVLAALLEARGSGTGQVVDAAIVDGSAHLNAMFASMLAGGDAREERAANLLDGGMPFYDVYETADGKHMAVGALEPQFYAALLEGLGLTGTAPDRYDPGAASGTAVRARCPVQGEDPGGVGGGVRRHRRLLHAGAAAVRGGRAPAPEGQVHLRDPRRAPAAGARAAVLPNGADADHRTVLAGRPVAVSTRGLGSTGCGRPGRLRRRRPTLSRRPVTFCAAPADEPSVSARPPASTRQLLRGLWRRGVTL